MASLVLESSEDLPGTLHGIRRAVLRWYEAEHRDFPWRRTRDPYAVLVSEVMLQQTQAARVTERFPRFLLRFPSAAAVAAATEADLLVEWSGLGYNRRALALKRACEQVTAHGWPRAVEDLERLPGVGPYTARAMASLAFGVPVGVVDTNVRRWLVRRLGLEPMGADGGPSALQSLADTLAWPRRHASVAPPDMAEVAAWTHASMELGGRICTARRPACGVCPIARGCPSRGRLVVVPVARQPSFKGSARARRGALLRALSESPGHALDPARLAQLRNGDAPVAWEATLDALEREGLIHRRSGGVRLGPPTREPETAAATATIGR